METREVRNGNRGFTLIELIVVMAIIAVLAVILAPQYLRYVEKSRIAVDCQVAAEILNAARTSCSEQDIYDSLDLKGDTLVWESDGKINGKITSKNKRLLNEVLKTATGDSKNNTIARQSRALKNKGKYTITIVPETRSTTYSITGEWSGTGNDSLDEDLTKKSGGK
ncbi:MAG: prepilin-type N-terminal cleavage/methylation domain-containing protein [Lachnospiraceae bacterium]|nr:prepilin-type N-terminal cleavage/methylation domain-containing protein [Lachnospiraceae bacterium]